MPLEGISEGLESDSGCESASPIIDPALAPLTLVRPIFRNLLGHQVSTLIVQFVNAGSQCQAMTQAPKLVLIGLDPALVRNLPVSRAMLGSLKWSLLDLDIAILFTSCSSNMSSEYEGFNPRVVPRICSP
ncbi:hypothetical protein VNO77_14466 [Canavalia gladiata]|uniref:Uncharacterized protein n=1 Tax=Canavalia gladiata TaxID=3824 RepID=A0AAN9LY67_CANGL